MFRDKSGALIVATVALCVAGPVSAKVSQAEADRLGKDLTCVGAEKAGNKDGTIPEYSGKWLGTPPGIDYKLHVGQHPVDPYPNDKPLYTITAQNMAQYADKLSDGQKAMFKKYPQTFRMPVYPTRRDFRYDDAVCEITKKNAMSAEVTDGGLGIKGGFMGGFLYPIPKDGYEALYNGTLAKRAGTEMTVRDIANVLPDGTVSWGRQDNRNLSMIGNPNDIGKPMDANGGVMAYSLAITLLPERDKGGLSISQEPVSFVKDKRLAWSYSPGTRRVRQLPEFGFDQPLGGTGGKMTIDSDRLFNGSPERYDWKLVGKREMYIPANSYRIHAKNVKYADLLKKGHENPDYMRYELRRVWIVEANLKKGFRHLYGKRVLFQDEDSWHAYMTDMYDARGQLWQWAFINYYYGFDINSWQAGTSFYHDLNSGGYVGYNLFQERDKGPVLNTFTLKPDMFTPAAARTYGT